MMGKAQYLLEKICISIPNDCGLSHTVVKYLTSAVIIAFYNGEIFVEFFYVRIFIVVHV